MERPVLQKSPLRQIIIIMIIIIIIITIIVIKMFMGLPVLLTKNV